MIRPMGSLNNKQNAPGVGRARPTVAHVLIEGSAIVVHREPIAMIRALIGICAVSYLTASSALQLKVWNDQPPGRLLKQDPNDTPTPWRDPYDFEGPPRYESLLGRCFSNQIQQYEYKLCPFRNATQREVSTGWNAFHGILGYVAQLIEILLSVFRSMWDKWRVSGDLSFFTMTYSDGTACSFNVRRYIEVCVLD